MDGWGVVLLLLSVLIGIIVTLRLMRGVNVNVYNNPQAHADAGGGGYHAGLHADVPRGSWGGPAISLVRVVGRLIVVLIAVSVLASLLTSHSPQQPSVVPLPAQEPIAVPAPTQVPTMAPLPTPVIVTVEVPAPAIAPTGLRDVRSREARISDASAGILVVIIALIVVSVILVVTGPKHQEHKAHPRKMVEQPPRQWIYGWAIPAEDVDGFREAVLNRRSGNGRE